MKWFNMFCGFLSNPKRGQTKLIDNSESDALTQPPERSESSSENILDSVINESVHNVVVLLDGDSDNLFNRNLLLNGAEGGIKAANQLDQAVRAYLRSASGGALVGKISIQCFVFINMWGTQKYLHSGYMSCGIAPRSDYFLEEFVRGFNMSRLPFVYVDTGRQKQSADKALIKFLHHYIATSPGTTIIVGGMHDGGYREHLAQYPIQLRTRKIRLLRGAHKVAPANGSLGSAMFKLPGLFGAFH